MGSQRVTVGSTEMVPPPHTVELKLEKKNSISEYLTYLVLCRVDKSAPTLYRISRIHCLSNCSGRADMPSQCVRWQWLWTLRHPWSKVSNLALALCSFRYYFLKFCIIHFLIGSRLNTFCWTCNNNTSMINDININNEEY